MPLLVYPVLSLVMQQFLLTMARPGPARYQIAVTSEEAGAQLQNILNRVPPPEPAPEKTTDSPEQTASAAPTTPPPAVFQIGYTGEDPLDLVRRRAADIGVQIEGGDEVRVKLFYLDQDPTSTQATKQLQQRLQQAQIKFLTDRLQALKANSTEPLAISTQPLQNPNQAPPLLATVVPLVLVLMTITGAVYPAIDLTAGERERGTLEAVMASPVSRPALLFSKYVAVVSVALLTAVANLSAMLLTLWSGGFLHLVIGKQSLSLLIVLQVLGLLVLLAAFFAGILLALTSIAKSFKEAQAYLIPIMLLSLAPGVLSLTPDVRLGGWVSVVPLVNIVLLTRDVLMSQVEAATATVTILTTLVYAIAGITVAAQIFGADALTRGSERSLATLLQRPAQISAVPTVAQAMLGLAILLPAYFVSSGLLGILAGESIQQRLLYSAILAGLLFGGIPAAMMWLGRVSLKTGFRLHRFTLWLLPAALAIGFTMWTGAHEFFLFAERLGFGGFDSETLNRAQQTLIAFRQQPLWLVLLAFAVAPAVFEELTFRGFVFSAIRKRGSPWRAILITAILFGLFHVISGRILTPERLVPSTLLGILLGWVAHRTGSVLPGILIHALHNGFLLTVAEYTEQLKAWGIGLEEQQHLPMSWLVGAAITIAIALYWVALTTRRSLVPPAAPLPAA